jgi:CrcB protein
MLQNLIFVAAGGALGAAARYLVVVASFQMFGRSFPWGTLIVNVAGSFTIGAIAILLSRHGGERIALFVVPGFLGGFTTLSAFSMDAMNLWNRGEVMLALAYVGATVILSLGAIALGSLIAIRLAS